MILLRFPPCSFELQPPACGTGVCAAPHAAGPGTSHLYDGAAAVVADKVADSKHHTARADHDGLAGQAQARSIAEPGRDAQPHEQAQSNELLFVDTTVSGWQNIVAQAKPNVQVILLDPARDPIDQIAQTMSREGKVDAMHIVSHGADGALQIGGRSMDLTALQGYSTQLATIGEHLTADGDILLYGCDIGEGAAGAQFVQALARWPGPRAPTWRRPPTRRPWAVTGCWNTASGKSTLPRYTLPADEQSLAALLQFLEQNFLLRADAPQASEKLAALAESRSRRDLRWLLHHYLYIRIPLVRPDRWLAVTLPYVSFIYTRARRAQAEAAGATIWSQLQRADVLEQGTAQRGLLGSRLRQEQAEAQGAAQEVERLELVAPFSGTLTDLDPLVHAGVWVDTRQELGMLMSGRTWYAEAFVDQASLQHLQVGDSARVYVPDSFEPLPARVVEIDSARTVTLPSPMLDAAHGGSIRVSTANNKHEVEHALYRVRMRLESPPRSWRSESAKVVIEGGRYSLGAHWLRALAGAVIRQSGF